MSENKSLPILLKNQKILLIGGGKVALQKAQVLYENNIDFTIISKELSKEIKMLTYSFKEKSFKLKDIKDFVIIIDATGNKKVASKLLKYKNTHNILLNIVDVPKYCDFYFMALTKNRPLQIAVSSNGASPTTAKYFRDECEKRIPKNISQYLEKKQDERNNEIISVKQTISELQKLDTKVYLVGCGLGDVTLLTLKAHTVIKSVDVVLYDHLISDEIIGIIPKNTKKLYVGKQKGHHSKSQEQINELIVQYVNEGLSVARLKSGDPFVFGRGAEELEYLVDKGISSEVIPGISSSIAGCSAVGIPITARGYAIGFTVVTAHLKDNSVNLDWVELLHRKNHTLVVLMGLSRVQEIVNESRRKSVDQNKRCAIISNATSVNEKVVITKLKHLVQDSQDIQRPAILVFGDVVSIRNLLFGCD